VHYKFPHLTTIEPVLRAIEGRDEFGNWKREDGDFAHSVIDYNVNFKDTFPLMQGTPEEQEIAALRRECRGIAYHPSTGEILSRPFNKFFNAGERLDSLVEDIDLTRPHHALTKLDGSMVRTIRTQGGVLFGTRAGVTNISEQARSYVEYMNPKINYTGFVNDMADAGRTCIFEWCTRKNRIVLDYPEDQLILTAIRYMINGEYIPYERMLQWAEPKGIPVVGHIPQRRDMTVFLSEVKAMTGVEGFVVLFDDGHRAKLKCDEYVLIHRTKDELRFEKDAVKIVLENRVDDLVPHLIPSDREHLLEFADAVNTHITNYARSIQTEFESLFVGNPSKKEFAESIKNNPRRAFLFQEHAYRFPPLDRKTGETVVKVPVRDFIVETILTHTGSGPMLEQVRYLFGAEWIPILFTGGDDA